MQLLRALTEELSELKAAIDAGAVWQINEEIGDVLFNIVSLVEAYREKHLTNLDIIDELISRKMQARHPYVFAQMRDPGPEVATALWDTEKLKEAETRFNSQVGVSFSYLLHEVPHENIIDQEWLRKNTLLMAGRISIAPTYINIGYAPGPESVAWVVIHGVLFDFLSVRASAIHRKMTVQGFTTSKLDPSSAYAALIDIFGPVSAEAVIHPLGSERLEKSLEKQAHLGNGVVEK